MKHRRPADGCQHRLLVRHFLDRLLRSELVPAQADPRVTLVQVLALVATPGFLIMCFLMRKYARLVPLDTRAAALASVNEKMLFIYLSMVVVGFAAVLEWDTLFPDRRDYLILSPLPIKDSTLFLSKASSLCVFLALFAAAANMLPALLYPMFTGSGLLQIARLAFSHTLSVFAADLFIFFSCVALRGLLLNSGRFSVHVSRLAQLVLLVALLSLFFTMPMVSFQSVQQNPGLRGSFAPAWFAALYEVLRGSKSAEFLPLASRACVALALAAGAFLLSYALTYTRRAGFGLNSGQPAAPTLFTLAGRTRALLEGYFLTSPAQRASFCFVVQTILRSQIHRTYAGAYLGVGLAFVTMGLATAVLRRGLAGMHIVQREFLSIPLVLSFFVLLGLRVVFSIPAQLRANWVFRLAEGDCTDLLCGARKVMIFLGVIPVLVVPFPFYWALWGWRVAVLHGVFCATLALILTEVLIYRLEKMPFTCTYSPGNANLKLWWWAYLFGFTTYAYSATELEEMLFAEPWLFIPCLTIALLVLIWLVRLRNRRNQRMTALRFQAEGPSAPEPLVLDARHA